MKAGILIKAVEASTISAVFSPTSIANIKKIKLIIVAIKQVILG